MEDGSSLRPGGSIARHTVVYGIGNLTRQLVGFLMLPIYTRFLSPSDYGVVGLLSVALAVLEPLFGARLASAIPKFYSEAADHDSKRAVMTSAIAVTTAASALTALVIYLFRVPASAAMFGSADYAVTTALFGLNILTQPIEHAGLMFIRLQHRSTLFLVVNLAKLLLQIALNVVLVVNVGLGVVGVVLGGVLSSALSGLGLTAYVFYYNPPRFDRATAWRMVTFSWPLWFGGVASLYVASSSRVFLRLFASLDDVGLLELGARFASIIQVMIWVPFSQHWEAVSYQSYREGDAPALFRTAFLVVSTLLVMGGLGVVTFSESVIVTMAGEPFHDAAGTVPFLTLGVILLSLSSFFFFSFMATANTSIASASQYLTSVVITLCFLAFIPRLGAVGAALAQCAAYAFTFTLTYYWSRRYFDPGITLGKLLSMLTIAACSYVLSNTLLGSTSMAVDIAIKLVIYVATCWILTVRTLRALKADHREFHDELWLTLSGVRARLTAGGTR